MLSHPQSIFLDISSPSITAFLAQPSKPDKTTAQSSLAVKEKLLKSLGGHLFSEDTYLCLTFFQCFSVAATKQGNKGRKREIEELRYCGVSQVNILG